MPCSVSIPAHRTERAISRIRLSDGLHRQAHDRAWGRSLRLAVKSLPGRSGSHVLLGRSQSQSLCPFHQRARSEAPLLYRHYPVSSLLRASPPPTRPSLALAGCSLRLPPLSPSVSRASCAFLRCMPSSLPRWNRRVHLSLASSATLAFPSYPIGRLPHRRFRGLVERSLALRPASSRDHQVILSTKGSDGFVTSSAASIATGQATLPRRDFHPLKHTRIHGARVGFDIVWVGVSPSVPRRSHAVLRIHRPLVELDGRISRIRLSDGLHRQAHDRALGRKPSPGRKVASRTLGFSCVARPKPIAIPLSLPPTCPK